MSHTENHKPGGNREHVPQPSRHRSLGQLVTDVFRDSSTLIHQELEFAKREVSQKVSKSTRDTLILVAGASIVYAGFLCVLAAAVLGLSRFMPQGLAAMLVGLAVMCSGGIVVLVSQKLLREKDLVPRRTIEALKENKEWIKDEIT